MGWRMTGMSWVALFVLTTSLWPSAQEKKDAERPAAPKVDNADLTKAAAAPVDPKSYIIGAEDVLLIRVWREPELSGPVAVRPDGKVSLPLVGELQASGLTPEQLVAKVSEGLTEYMRQPQVTVSVQAVNSKRYFISGEINRPGAYPLVVPTSVLEALTNAGGFREFADKKKIFILRGARRYPFNYKDVIQGKTMGQNMLLQSGDHIIVP